MRSNRFRDEVVIAVISIIVGGAAAIFMAFLAIATQSTTMTM